ncbi:alcohol dehydrogenase [Rhodococcus aetherivorans]|uniref:Alcohol dehydrogenase n=2 Tax=Rhodococcus aetherivorans TaxID=191292 RepID=A0ABQ0YTI4_9NOCA|nr:maleylacetate reductase [Rhodococcus aetherivorans]ETT25565.1 Maleylacetate reductase [Rhodococcus rhodochrous ATCC 21198]MDV6296486.1 maleylacetate reductase [Rhodococcus aetherivorans]NGP26697.1 maleylacetate reductase [Rhodococcus aetherivorans]GES39919.1 alcohol dehydrogenase [Rhodococcus aetherivorans]
MNPQIGITSAAPRPTPKGRFVYEALPMRVRFGVDALSTLPDELDQIGLQRVLVICSPDQKAMGTRVAEALGDRSVGVLPEAVMHVPAEVAHRASAEAARVGADGCVAVGGGSAIGLGKAIALEHGLPIVAVPTTYAGSEMTPVWGLTTDGLKTTGRDPRVLPRSVVYDPALTATLPVAMSVTSGINAMAHAVEALYAPDATPIISLMAEDGVRALATALPAIAADSSDLSARSEALYGSWLCGACLGATTMSLHHKLCHSLGGTLNLPHAQTHTVVLPHALAFNQPAAAGATAALSRALGGAADPAARLWELAGELGAPRSLAELGAQESDLDRIADEVTSRPYGNPRPVTYNDVRGLLQAAWAGKPPTANPLR